ncbi:MAG: hypothetical protein ACREOM_06340 [Candidatus Dormibacteraceae bacterium]
MNAGRVPSYAFVIAVLILASACSTSGNGVSRAVSSPTSQIMSNACVAEPSPIDQVIQQFVADWNQHQADPVVRLFSDDAELDMSAASQGTQNERSEQRWTVSVGQSRIQAFAEQQWGLGEQLAFSSVESFSGGGYAIGMKATFADGRKQAMSEAKFAYDSCPALLSHVVIVAASPATSWPRPSTANGS